MFEGNRIRAVVDDQPPDAQQSNGEVQQSNAQQSNDDEEPSLRPYIMSQKLHQKATGLLVSVPANDPQSLGPPIDLSSPSSPKAFETITQLPTPILGNTAFVSYKLDVRKRNKSPEKHSANRVVSEFAPLHVAHKSTPSPCRHLSNPSGILKHSPQSFPLPPLDSDSVIPDGAFYAPRSDRHYIPEATIGTGSFSSVYLARNIENHSDVVAVKVISVPLLDAPSIENFRSYIARELGILSHLRHPGIVHLLDYNVKMQLTQAEIDSTFIDTLSLIANHSEESIPIQSLEKPNPASKVSVAELIERYDIGNSTNQVFFLQYAEGGNLFQLLESNYSKWGNEVGFWQLMQRLVAELVASVSYLHSQKVVHRDIKLENILLNFKADWNSIAQDSRKLEMAVSTLTDFGLSKRLSHPSQLLSTKCGSQDYVSPELLMGVKYDGMLLDSWSIGVVVYSILENRLPFDVPPLDYVESSNISPSVLKRRRGRHNPGYRIAMIDWDWYRIPVVMNGKTLAPEAKEIISQLVALVEALLVRKDKRKSATQLLRDKNFCWIQDCLPGTFKYFL